MHFAVTITFCALAVGPRRVPGWHMANARERYSVSRDLIEDSLELLAGRQAKYPGDDLAAIRVLADPASQTEAALA